MIKAYNPYLFIGKILFGKWKMVLLRDMSCYGYIRFNNTLKYLPITEKVLSEQLKDLIAQGLVYREDYDELPYRVEYYLTEVGHELVDISDDFFIWAIKDMVNKGIEIDRDALAVHNCEKFTKALEDVISKIDGYKEIIESETINKVGSSGSGTLNNPYLYLGSVLAGKWKMSLLHKIAHDGYLRFSTAKKEFNISEKVLAEQIHQLTEDGLIHRIQYDTIPLKVEYFLTDSGKAIMPSIDKLYIWTIKRMFELQVHIDPNAFIVHTDDKYESELKDIIDKIPEYKEAVRKNKKHDK